MTNGSKVLIYLTLLYFIFYCTHVSNGKKNIAKSNKSEVWNRLSFIGPPYLFEVKPKFQEQLQNFEVAASKFNIDRHTTPKTLERPKCELKKNVMG
jgi:hypothetical protein